jgi:hypothetical protein
MEPAGEYLAVIGQDLLGRPVDLNATRNPSQQADGSEAVNRSRCKESAETLSGINRNRNVKHRPRQYTLFSGAGGARTRDQRISKRPLAAGR